MLVLSLVIGFLSDLIPHTAIVSYLVIRFLVDPELSLGSFSASIMATFKLFWAINDTGNYLTKFHEHSLYIEKVRKFVGYEPKIKGDVTDVPAFESLTVRGLDFTYPFDKDEKKTLSGIDLEIKRGEKIAFVGYNGAGKTTLTKLLMRLYDATDGEILYNGQNVTEFAPAEYRKH
ncbi:MAG: ABC transporter ATP-binding protein, partial [Clostridia bacterium]|nr:ABC transporter ATP-binding protein [Clostridia bacterium]